MVHNAEVTFLDVLEDFFSIKFAVETYILFLLYMYSEIKLAFR